MNSNGLKRSIYVAILIITFLAFFFPADRDGYFYFIYSVGDNISDIRAKRLYSDFPGAFVVTYLVSIIFGIGFAVLGCFSREITRLVGLLKSFRGKVGGVLFSIGLITPPFIIMFVEIQPGSNGFSSVFFSLLSNNRIVLAVWCNAVFVLFFVSFQIFFASMILLFDSGEKK